MAGAWSLAPTESVSGVCITQFERVRERLDAREEQCVEAIRLRAHRSLQRLAVRLALPAEFDIAARRAHDDFRHARAEYREQVESGHAGHPHIGRDECDGLRRSHDDR